MRCRRLCEKKPSGKVHVDENVSSQYRAGGEPREILEMALLECIAKHGMDRRAYKRIKASPMFVYIFKCLFLYVARPQKCVHAPGGLQYKMPPYSGKA